MTGNVKFVTISRESMGFGLVLLIVWLNVFIDLPKRLFDIPGASVEVGEIPFRTTIAVLIAAFTLRVMLWLFRCIQCRGSLAGIVDRLEEKEAESVSQSMLDQ